MKTCSPVSAEARVHAGAKISIKVQQTEVSVSVAPAPPLATAPVRCPQCGGNWVTGFASRASIAGLSVAALERAVAEMRLHLHCTPAHELWICERSLKDVKENL